MATFVPLLGELTGSIGDVTFSHNKGGAYVRRRSIPTNPTTVKQTSARAAMASLSARWQDLTAEQRMEWSMWAETHPTTNRAGMSILLTGQQAYVGCNARLVQASSTPNDDCPLTTTPSDLDTAAITATAATSEIELTYTGTVPTGGRVLIWQTLPQQAGNNPNRRQARLVGYSDVDPTSPITLVSPYAALATQTSNMWVQVMDASGQVSAGLRVNVVYA